MIRAIILMALREIRRNLLRSSLTMLGVVIGVAAVVALVHVARGATSSVTSSFASMGHNMLTVFPGAMRRGPTPTSAPRFDLKDAQAIENEVQGLEAVAPAVTHSTTVVYGNKNWRTRVTGTTASFAQIRNYSLDAGRMMDGDDEQTGRSICVLGATTKKELFGPATAVGQTLRVGKITCDVIGVFKSKGEGASTSDQDDIIVMPLSIVQRRLAGNHDVNTIYVSVKDGRPTALAKYQITSLMRQRRNIQQGQEDNFNVFDMQEIMSAMESASAALTALLGAIAAVSLLVGGIGIMNIMLVSVTERTREIGTRLAIGATSGEVLLQFLVESVMLSTLGGCIGVVLGLVGSGIASKYMNFSFAVSPDIVIIAFVFSGTIGVIFGFLPARKAANLNPIEALRHE